MIEIRNLSKKFGNFLAVDNLSLNIGRGEFYCLLGPNGAGKTTTLKMACGLMPPSGGNIVIDGMDISRDYLAVKKNLGFIPDAPFVYENLTPCEFLEFIASIFSLDEKESRSRANRYFDLFGLDSVKDVMIKDLSHGMRQKVVYIANFIHSPSVYLIDEPLVGLDPYSIHLLKKILKQEVEKGRTILMCTHILSVAEELADRIGILHKGKLAAQGTLAQLKSDVNASSLEELFLRITC